MLITLLRNKRRKFAKKEANFNSTLSEKFQDLTYKSSPTIKAKSRRLSCNISKQVLDYVIDNNFDIKSGSIVNPLIRLMREDQIQKKKLELIKNNLLLNDTESNQDLSNQIENVKVESKKDLLSYYIKKKNIK